MIVLTDKIYDNNFGELRKKIYKKIELGLKTQNIM